MSEFTKWESKSVKISIVFPVVFLVTGILVAVILWFLQPPPPEIKKKDASAAAELEEAAKQEEIDWANF
jgi:predicted histidine transporter YuiF (NhaC family)